MPTNRMPRVRNARTKITAVALNLYERGKRGLPCAGGGAARAP